MGWIERIATLLLVSAVLAACGGGGGGSSDPIVQPGGTPQSAKERIAALEAEGRLPKLDRSPDLKGPDTPSAKLFDVLVSKDQRTGRMTARLGT